MRLFLLMIPPHSPPAISTQFKNLTDRVLSSLKQSRNIRPLSAVWLLTLVGTTTVPLSNGQEAGILSKIVPNDEWQPIDQSDAQVQAGTALDFSFLVEGGEAGQHGFSIINDQGELSFQNRPDLMPKYFCAPQLPLTDIDLDVESIDRLAEQLRLAGYNCVRAHFLDMMLMWDSSEDFVFNPVMLDRWDRYTAALKKRGIYLIIDITTKKSGFTPFKEWDSRGSDVHLKSRLYFDEEMRTHWSKGARALLEHINPYTGVALKDEPQVVAFAIRNESGLQFLQNVPKYANPDIVFPFRKWLKHKYSTTEALQAAWQSLEAGETIDTVGLPATNSKGVNARDLALFYTDIERSTYLWAADTLREMGVKVPIYDYNIGGSIQSTITRDVLPLVDNHAYHDHPDGPWLESGQRIHGENALASRVGNIRWITQTRHWGRSIICTEWGFPFWNATRHQGGAVISAYASFQGWQMLAQHSGPVIDPASKDPLRARPFDVARDPAAKASERMAAFLFARGDVMRSPHKIEICVDANTIFQNLNAHQALNSELTDLSLLAGLGVTVKNGINPGPRAPIVADLTINPNGTEEVVTIGGGAQQSVDLKTGNSGEQMVDLMRKKGILGPSNLTDVKKGVYQSDTAQILLEETRFSVNTPRSKALCLREGDLNVKVGDLEASNLGAPCTLFLASLTQDPINKSGRLLLIVSGDALNNGMIFKDEKLLELVNLGGPPVLVRVLNVQIRIHLSTPTDTLSQIPGVFQPPQKGWKAWALAQNGTRRQEVPLTVKDGCLELALDTGKLQGGPTPYFEIERN